MSVRDLIILGCSAQQPTRKRNHGAYLLRWNEKGFLFDPGEGTQRQFIYADVAPPTVTHIFVSHFHGDHCLGLGSMLMRLNLDKVTHPIHCFYPASGQKYFDRLRYGTMYHENINVILHPIDQGGIIYKDEGFTIEAQFLDHGVDNLGYRLKEDDQLKFDRAKLNAHGVKGPLVRQLQDQGHVEIGGKTVTLEDVSWLRQGDIFAYVIDTRPCKNAIHLARDASMLLCESTFLSDSADLARKYHHMTATEAAQIASQAHAKQLILTHFSARYLDEEVFAEEARKIFPNAYAAKDLRRFEFSRTDFKK
ncbi:MAG: ribonuclease Z [Chlamydiales bacterium]|nr:ribonuclease Z [Chlamydiales bacterium]